MYGKITTALNTGIEALHAICSYPLNNNLNAKICKQLIPYNVFNNVLLYNNDKKNYDDINDTNVTIKDYYSIYLSLKHKNFGENSKYHINCPKCDRIVERPVPSPQCQIQCICEQSICLKCGEPINHLPLPCDLVKVFYSLCTDSNEDFIRAITKSCPNCHVLIEKDRNCNHMTCTRCGHQFCWLCKGSWDLHISSYECPRFAKEDNMTTDAKNEYETTIEYAKMLQSTELVKIEFENRRKITQDFQVIANYIYNIEDLCTKKQHQSILFASRVSEYIVWSGVLVLYCESNPTRELLHQSVRSIEKVLNELHTILLPLLYKIKDATSLLIDKNMNDTSKITHFYLNDITIYKNMIEQFCDTIPNLHKWYDTLVKVVNDPSLIPTYTLENTHKYGWACKRCHQLNYNSLTCILARLVACGATHDVIIKAKEDFESKKKIVYDIASKRLLDQRHVSIEVCTKCHSCRIHCENDCRLCIPR